MKYRVELNETIQAVSIYELEARSKADAEHKIRNEIGDSEQVSFYQENRKINTIYSVRTVRGKP